MVDYFHRDPAILGFLERSRCITVQGRPGFFVDLSLKCGLQRAVGVVGAQEVGVADEEAFFVVVGVDEPAGDAVGTVADDFAGLGLEDVHTVVFFGVRLSTLDNLIEVEILSPCLKGLDDCHLTHLLT